MTRLDAGPAESRRAPLPRCLTLTMQIKCAQTSTAWKGGGAIPVVVVVVAMASTRRDFFDQRGSNAVAWDGEQEPEMASGVLAYQHGVQVNLACDESRE